MKCKNCNNNLVSSDKFCSKCGTKLVNKNNNFKLILLRTLLLVFFVVVFLKSEAANTSNGLIFIIITILSFICYFLILFFILKKFNITKYSDCILTNSISILIYAFLSLFVIYKMDCLTNGVCDKYSILYIFILNICIVPVSFVSNVIIDFIIITINNKMSKKLNNISK